MIGNERQLIRMQAQIQRVDDAAGVGDPKITFQMNVMVPQQGCDPIAPFQAGAMERLRQGARPAAEVGVAIAMQRTIGPAGDNFDFAE